MTQAERRHDRLAVRLSLIISRLVAGETLSVRKLAAEFGVSVRTLRRDFRERLMYLDLEYQSGYCRLRTAGSEMQMVPDVLIFAHRSGLAGLFPGLDRRLVNALLMCDESPCVIAPANPVPSPSGALSFWRLIQAITGRRRVTLIAEGRRCERLAPCRLLIHQQTWYLVAEHEGHIAVFTLDEIHLIHMFRISDSGNNLGTAQLLGKSCDDDILLVTVGAGNEKIAVLHGMPLKETNLSRITGYRHNIVLLGNFI